MRLPRIEPHHVALALLLAVLAVGTALLSPRTSGGERKGDSPSAFNDDDSGLRGLYLTCEGLGLPVGAYQRPMEALDGTVGSLVLVAGPGAAPPMGNLRDWVRSGGRLLLADTTEGSPILASFGPRVRPALRADPAPAGRATSWGVPRRGLPSTTRAFDPASLPDGVEVLARVDAADGRPWVVKVPFGRGSVVALADPDFLRNLRLGDGASPVLAVRLVEETAAGGPVLFCETVHGYGASGDPMSALWVVLRTTPLGHAALGAAAFALLALVAGAPRFGRVRRVLETPRRSEYEFIEALAGLLRHAKAWPQAGSLLVQGLRRRLAPAGRAAEGASLAASLAWDRPERAAAVDRDAAEVARGAGPAAMAAALSRVDAAVAEEHARLRRA